MKATGIVRRIDDLGRVVIPKEIRRTQHIRVGDPLEIYVSGEGEVIFKKYYHDTKKRINNEREKQNTVYSWYCCGMRGLCR